MLHQLFIQNYAIIDQLKINFTRHLNVITGETGAGKSILMGALSLILGDRADTSVLLDKEFKCIVEGTFKIKRASVTSFLKENDLDGDSDLIIRREISPSGKSRAFINDTPVNLNQLKELTALLVDLHRQFDIQNLNTSDFQLDVLDALAGNSQLLADYKNVYSEYTVARHHLNELKIWRDEAAREYDYHKFLFDELEDAGFRDNEIEDTEASLKMMSNAENIKSVIETSVHILGGDESSVLQNLRLLVSKLSGVKNFVSEISSLEERIQSAYLELKDISDELESVNDKISFSEKELADLNERMDLAYTLLKKHKVHTTAELLSVKAELDASLLRTTDMEMEIVKKEELLTGLFGKLTELSKQLSVRRQKQLPDLTTKVNGLLQIVGMPGAAFKVVLQPLEVPAADGSDAVDFLFNANKTTFQPMRKVASGGELSRLMLIIKSLVARSMQLPTLIFDEIDTGISGEAARQVGNIIKELSGDHQIILITHQPQIAARAYTHFFVYKEKKGDKIVTRVRVLDGEERIKTIATMLSGEKPTQAAFDNAREMMN